MKKSLTVNYIYNMIYKILMLITPLITTPYVSRVLGVENIGIYNYIYSVLSYFVLFGVLGLQMYGQREIAYVSDDQEKKNKVFWEIVWTRIITTITALIIYCVFSAFTGYKVYYLIFGIELIANAIDISWLYYGVEEFKKITIRNVIIKIIGIICIFLFVKDVNDLDIYIICHVLVLLLGNLSLWIGVKKQISNIKKPSKVCFKHIKVAIIFFLPQCLDSIYMLMDKVMLGNISTMEQVGIYGQADKIVKMVVTVITSLGLVVSPRIAKSYKDGNKSEIKKYMDNSFYFVFFMSFPMIFGLIGVSNVFSNWFFGEGYNGVAEMINILAPVILFMGLNSVIGWQYLMTVGREKDFTISVTVGAITNFLLNVVLINKFNAMGAAIASIISMFIMTIINFYLIKDLVKIKEVLIKIPKLLVASIIMLLIIKPIQLIKLTPRLITFIQVIVGIIVYLGILIIFKDKMVKKYLSRIAIKN